MVVLNRKGGLTGGLFVTRNGQLPEREWIASQLNAAAPQAIELLAGRPSMPEVERGPIVCVCHGIGSKQIKAAAEDGAGTVAAIGAACSAGTNCGSCRPAIARLLRAWNDELAEVAE